MAERRKKGAGQGSCHSCEAAREMLEALHKTCAVDQDILGIEEAAKLMRCSVDTVRRIPTEELPAYRVGRENLYVREEVIGFVKTRPVCAADVYAVLEEVVDCVEQQIPAVLDSGPADARRRSKRRAS